MSFRVIRHLLAVAVGAKTHAMMKTSKTSAASSIPRVLLMSMQHGAFNRRYLSSRAAILYVGQWYA
jgi:hypothetical protein